MPVMDGRRATELIRHWELQRLTNGRVTGPLSELFPEGLRHDLLPIIFVTGNVMPGEEALMLSSGATKVRARRKMLFFSRQDKRQVFTKKIACADLDSYDLAL